MTLETYDNLKQCIGSKNDFADDLINFGYTKGKADERVRTIDECKEVLRQHWLHGTVAYRIINEINESLEQLKEQNNERKQM